jgi:excisionase family DNA binding protein
MLYGVGMTNTHTPTLLTAVEVQDLLHVSDRTLRRLRNTRQIGFIRVGGKALFTESDVDAYLESRRVEAK